MPTLAHWLRSAAATLHSTSPSPQLDAEVLARSALALTPTQLIVQAERELGAGEAAALSRLLARRARGEPVAYIVGEREFWSLPLKVDANVLIPRPETELLVTQALRHIPTGQRCTVADLGTGSGAIALAIARERPLAQVIATDISAAALTIAQDNARALNLLNIEFRRSDWCDALRETCRVVVGNPPYIRDDDAHLLQGDVRFEPRLALTAGGDGLVAIRTIVAQAQLHLAPGGVLILEHGFDQQTAVLEILASHNYAAAEALADLSGQPRAVVAFAAARGQ